MRHLVAGVAVGVFLLSRLQLSERLFQTFELALKLFQLRLLASRLAAALTGFAGDRRVVIVIFRCTV